MGGLVGSIGYGWTTASGSDQSYDFKLDAIRTEARSHEWDTEKGGCSKCRMNN